jgi:4-amino-4-deoxy-L-arabinose transferase-like glycosyltransferase
VILAVAATALRVIAPSRLAIDHFDEGAYAMTAAALASGDGPAIYPLQHFLAPPLFYSLAAALTRIAGTTASSLFDVSVAAGVGTVVIVYLGGRLWFGREAAGVAALAVALSDFHILYSRAALTDALFVGLFVAAIVVLWKAEERSSWTLAALAGVVTGLAWNTKYHGWLAVVVAALAATPRLLTPERRALRATVVRLVVAGAVALSLYVPWILYVEAQPGGYARLASEHSRFLQPSQIVQNGLAQLRSQLYLEGWTARLSPLALVVWVTLINPVTRRMDSLWLAILLALTSLALGATTLIGILALGAAAMVLRRLGTRGSPGLPLGYPLAFFAVFTALTPLYFPYARLLLPWFVAATLLAGFALNAMLVAGLPSRGRRNGALAIAGTMILVLVARGLPAAASPWGSRTGLQTATFEVNRIASESGPIVVLGEPGTVFYLRQLGREAWHIDRPDDAARYVPAGSSYYLVAGIYSRRVRGPISLATWLKNHPEASQVGTAPVPDMSDVRLLDDFTPANARRFRLEQRRDYDLNIYLVRRNQR